MVILQKKFHRLAKIRRSALKPEKNTGFFVVTSGSAAQSSILMFLRHSLSMKHKRYDDFKTSSIPELRFAEKA